MNNVANFFNEVRVELSKVIWPNRDEFIGSTIVALVIMAFFMVYLGSVDLGLSKLIRYIFDHSGMY